MISLSFAAELDSRVRNKICKGRREEEKNHKNKDCFWASGGRSDRAEVIYQEWVRAGIIETQLQEFA